MLLLLHLGYAHFSSMLLTKLQPPCLQSSCLFRPMFRFCAPNRGYNFLNIDVQTQSRKSSVKPDMSCLTESGRILEGEEAYLRGGLIKKSTL